MMDRFVEFIELVRTWPGSRYAPRYESIRLEYQACLMQGITEEQIVEGTREFLRRQVPLDTDNFYMLAPHNFLREKSFLFYVPQKEGLKAVK